MLEIISLRRRFDVEYFISFDHNLKLYNIECILKFLITSLKKKFKYIHEFGSTDTTNII